MLAPELAPIVHALFTQSLDTGELPRDWCLANVAPIFKKGNRVLAENYRPGVGFSSDAALRFAGFSQDS